MANSIQKNDFVSIADWHYLLLVPRHPEWAGIDPDHPERPALTRDPGKPKGRKSEPGPKVEPEFNRARQPSDPEIFRKIKAALSITRVITDATGLKKGRWHLDACPFCAHHDCFSITESAGRFKCFSCGASGDVFEFLERFKGLTKADALREAAAMAGIELPTRTKTAAAQPAQPQQKPLENVKKEAAAMATNEERPSIILPFPTVGGALGFCTAADVFASSKVPDPIVAGMGLESGAIDYLGSGRRGQIVIRALHGAAPGARSTNRRRRRDRPVR